MSLFAKVHVAMILAMTFFAVIAAATVNKPSKKTPFYSFCTFKKHTTSADITESPLSVNISLNRVAEFTCIGIGNFINWDINGEPLDDSRTGFDQMVVTLNKTQGLRKSTVIAVALLENNNTNLSCIVAAVSMSLSLSIISEPALFRIQGM